MAFRLASNGSLHAAPTAGPFTVIASPAIGTSLEPEKGPIVGF